MKLLLINPNITAAMTASMAAEARRFATAGTEITAVTASFGTQYVENWAEAAIAAHAVLDALARTWPVTTRRSSPRSAILGSPPRASSPTSLCSALRSRLADRLDPAGRRIAIICLTPRLGRWYQECAEEHGLAGRLVSVRALDVTIPDITQAKHQLRDRLLAECDRAVEEDAAEVIIFGGGPIAGLAREAAADIDRPRWTASVARSVWPRRCGSAPSPSGTRSFARPRPKPAQGLSPRADAAHRGLKWA